MRTLFFLACQKVVGEQQKEDPSFVLKNVNEVWNEKLEKEFWEASKYVKESKVGDDETKVEKVFNTPVCDKYSRVKFSLEETDRIIRLVEDGLNRCKEINEDFYYEIKDFEKIYYVYIISYKSLDI